MDAPITIREYARRLGIHEATVRKAIKAGKIVKGIVINKKNKRPQIIQSIADKEWGNSYSGKTNSSPILKEKFGHASPESSLDVPGTGDDQDNSGAMKNPRTMKDAQLKEQIYKANMAEIKYNEALGKLIKKDKVYKSFFEFGTQVRESIQSVPDRVVDLMLACTSRNEAHELLSAELARALETLSSFKNTEKITDDEDEA